MEVSHRFGVFALIIILFLLIPCRGKARNQWGHHDVFAYVCVRVCETLPCEQDRPISRRERCLNFVGVLIVHCK